jgi:hypothetical protein
LVALLAQPASAMTIRWTTVPSTSLSGTHPVYTFSQTSCVSGSYCLAVGGGSNTAQTNTTSVVERWNGSSWAPMAGTVRVGTFYSGVHCFSTSNCLIDGTRAVGTGGTIYNGPYAGVFAHWNGSVWSTSSFSPTGGYYLGTACPATNRCFVVGLIHTSSAHDHVSIVRWNGSGWSLMSAPNPAGQVIAELFSVSCPTISWCDAVGIERATSTSPVHLFGEHFNGSTWTLFSMPSPKGRPWDWPVQLQCPSTSLCLVAGQSQTAANVFPAALVERWNGTSWAVMPLPSTVASGISAFGDLACRSNSFCWGVGWKGSPAHPAVAFWNGSSFGLGQNAAATAYGDLETVGCASNRCVAIGNHFTSSSTSITLGEQVAVP